MVCIDKLNNQGYVDMGEFWGKGYSKLYYEEQLEKMGSVIAELYKKPMKYQEMMKKEWDCLRLDQRVNPETLTPFEAKALIIWVLFPYSNQAKKKAALFSVLKQYGVDNGKTIRQSNYFLYDNKKVDLNMINSFDQYFKMLHGLQKQGITAYYRGHADCGFSLLPSIMRSSGWSEHECDLYNQTVIECPDSFSNCRTHLDYLVEMQHYGLPTRLLDVTKNPLIALYFACCDLSDCNGEVIVFDVESEQIKYSKSDTVSILASLPLLKKSAKEDIKNWASDASLNIEQFNIKAARLLQEIKLEKPSFQSEIKKEDVLNCFFVQAEKKNSRIIKQDGAFIICGLLDEKENKLIALKHKENGKTQVYIINKKKKKEMLQQLEHLSINHAQLFPEIQDVTAHIKNQY